FQRDCTTLFEGFSGRKEMKGKNMTPIRITLLASAAAILMSGPAAASLVSFTHIRPVQPTVIQYAQDFRHGSSPVDYGYKSKKKTAKSKKSTTGSAKSTDTDKAK